MNNDQTNDWIFSWCYGCFYFYITYKKKRPYGCKKFGFISKIIPSSEVFNTTGTECAYRSDKNL